MSSSNRIAEQDWDRLESEQGAEGPRLSYVIGRTLKNWPWLILSVVVFTAIGVAIVLRTPKTYLENAQVVIKNDNEGGSSNKLNNFNDLGIFSRNTNVLNEIATMSSPDVMADVVKMLDLTIEYTQPGTFHDIALYGKNLPIKVSFPDASDDKQLSFKLDIEGNGKYYLSKLKYYDRKNNKWIKTGKEYSGNLGTPLKTVCGTIVVNPGEFYGAGKDYEILVSKNSLPSTIIKYTKMVKVELDDDDSTVVDLSMTDQNRQRADEVLAAMIAVYNENWIKEKNQIAVSTSQFIDDRLGVIEGELGTVDSDISKYKTDNLLPDVSNMTASYIKEQEELSKTIVNLEGQLDAARNLRARLVAAGNDGSVLPANTVIENSSLMSQIKEYNDLLMKRNALEEKSSEKNPIVQQLDEQIRQLRGAVLSSTESAVQGLESKIRALQSAKSSATQRIASSPNQAKYLLSVERQQKVKENLYLFLLQKREDNELNQAFTAYNTRIIKRPGGDGIPTAPKTGLILLSLFFVGFFIPFGYSYYIEMWDNKLRSRQDVDGLKTPMIGEIPFDTKTAKAQKKGEKPTIIVSMGQRDLTNEAFRVTRTNVEFTRVHKDKCNVLALTSFNPGSGKSFIAVNLGASLALKGKKVIVVDGDFRRGTASEYVNKPEEGLSDYLAGHISNWHKLVVSSSQEGLSVMPAGNRPPNPTELLETERFVRMIEEMRKDYDYIIIDCPPIEVVADAHIINPVVDTTIFVLRIGLLDKRLLRELERFYAEKKFNHLSFILNASDNDHIAYGGRKRFGYGNTKAYGYGYGN